MEKILTYAKKKNDPHRDINKTRIGSVKISTSSIWILQHPCEYINNIFEY